MSVIRTEDNLTYTFHPVTKFEVSLTIKAGHDGHIALTPGASADAGQIIEIFLGGWDGQKSAIRLNKEKPDKAIVDTPDILSDGEERTFVVRWTNTGDLRVLRNDETEPLLHWVNPEPFVITHFGIRTSWGATGEWKIDGAKEVSTPDSPEYTFFQVHGSDLVFDVRAQSNAHIALTSGPADEAPLYEIFLGGWDNTKSAIRLNKEKPDVSEAATEQIVNDTEFKRFRVKWNYAGISVTRDGDDAPLLNYSNPDPTTVTHFGIRTGWGAEGEWLIHELDSGVTPPAVPEPREKREADPEPVETNEVETTEEVIETVEITTVSWVPAAGGEVPEGSLVGGNDNGEDIIVARASYEGALLPGKLIAAHGVCYIPWGGEEHAEEQYETLVVSQDAVSWVPSNGGEIPENAIPGGTALDGETLYVGRTQHEDTLTVGKFHPSHETLYISYGGAEIGFPVFEVLVLN